MPNALPLDSRRARQPRGAGRDDRALPEPIAHDPRVSKPSARADQKLPRRILVAGLLVIAASGVMTAASMAPTSAVDPQSAPMRWVAIGNGLFTTLLGLTLAWFAARSLVIAYWLAAAVAVLLLLASVSSDSAWTWSSVAPVIGGLTTLAGVATLAGSSLARNRTAGAPGLRLPWATTLRIILVVHLVAMLGWVSNYLIFTVIAGLIGFRDFWTVPFGIAVVATLVVGGVMYRADSTPARLVAMGGLTGSTAALLYSLSSGQSPVTQVIIAILVGLAIAGILIASLDGQFASMEDGPAQ